MRCYTRSKPIVLPRCDNLVFLSFARCLSSAFVLPVHRLVRPTSAIAVQRSVSLSQATSVIHETFWYIMLLWNHSCTAVDQLDEYSVRMWTAWDSLSSDRRSLYACFGSLRPSPLFICYEPRMCHLFTMLCRLSTSTHNTSPASCRVHMMAGGKLEGALILYRLTLASL